MSRVIGRGMGRAVVVNEYESPSFVSDPPEKREFRVILSPHLQENAPDLLSVCTAEVYPLQSTPYHSHEWEDEVWYVISGRGQIKVGQELHDVRPGSVVVAPKGVGHQLINPNRYGYLKCLVMFTPAGPEEMFLPKEEADAV